MAFFLPTDPPPPTLGSSFNFFRTWSCCISSQMESQLQQHGSKYFTHRPPPTHPSPTDPGVFKFWERAHDAYKVEWSRKCCNIVANLHYTCRPLPPPDPGGGVIIQPFQNMVTLHIKLKESGIESHSSTYYPFHTVSTYAPNCLLPRYLRESTLEGTTFTQWNMENIGLIHKWSIEYKSLITL